MSDSNQESAQLKEGAFSLLDLVVTFARHKKKIFLVPILAGCITAVYSLQIPEIYSANTTIIPIPPKAFTVTASGQVYEERTETKESTAELLKVMLKSRRLQDTIISKYETKTGNRGIPFSDARGNLINATTISVGRRDSVVKIEIEDESPEKAAQLANDHVSTLTEMVFEMKKNLAVKRQEASTNMARAFSSKLKGELSQIVNGEGQNAVMFQVLDVAEPPTTRAHPRRTEMVMIVSIVVGFMMCLVTFIMEVRERALGDPVQAKKLEEVRRNLGRF